MIENKCFPKHKLLLHGEKIPEKITVRRVGG